MGGHQGVVSAVRKFSEPPAASVRLPVCLSPREWLVQYHLVLRTSSCCYCRCKITHMSRTQGVASAAILTSQNFQLQNCYCRCYITPMWEYIFLGQGYVQRYL